MSVILNSPNVVIGHMSGGTININGAKESESAPKQHPQEVQDIVPEQEEHPAENVDSIIFTKKAKKEGKEAYIIQALQKSVIGRKDKTRAFVDELQEWQKEHYIDPHYNAKVMYDELEKLTPLSFSYDTFRKYYNHLI